MSNFAHAGWLVKDRLEGINPETWVADTPAGLALAIIMDLGEAGLLKEDPKPEAPLKTGDCGGRYWHDEHPYSVRSAKGVTRLHCKGR